MRFPSGLVLLLILPIMSGCIASADDGKQLAKADRCEWSLTMQYIEGSEDVGGLATVRWLEIEGGFWGLESDAGEKFQPQGDFCEDLQEDGLRVRFDGRTRPDMASIHQWGMIIDLRLIERA